MQEAEGPMLTCQTGNGVDKMSPNPQNSDSQPPELLTYYWANNIPLFKADWLVEDLFPNRSLNLIVGESQAGKSYLGLDLAIAVATGRPFLGKSVLQGGVLFIATEGQITIGGRLMAARQGLPLNDKLVAVIQEAPADLMKAADVDRIIATAKHISEEMMAKAGFPLRMIILDTMMSGFDIDDWNSVSHTSDAMKVLRRIKDEVGVTVIAVHHHGKDSSRGAAGSYALTAHPDAILSVYKKDSEGAVKKRWATLTKSRFGETGRKIAFELRQKLPDEREDESDDEAFVVLSSKDIADVSNSKQPGSSKCSHGDECFRSCCAVALEDHGLELTYGDEKVRAAPLSVAKELFMGSYKPKGNGGDPIAAARKAWDRAFAKSLKNGTIFHGDHKGETWFSIGTSLDSSKTKTDGQ